MAKRAWIGHACWAGVALAAFGAGSLRDKALSGAKRASQPGSPEAGSKGVRMASATGHGLSSRSSRTDGKADADGPMNDLFQIPGTPRSDADLEALALAALKDGNPVSRRLAFSRLLESMTPENAMQLRGYLKEMKADKSQWNDFHYAWGAINGMEALQNGMKTAEWDMSPTMSGWASAYPSEAEAFLRNLPEDVKTDRNLLKQSLVAGMADRDPGMATDLVYRMAAQGEENASRLLSTVAEEILQTTSPEEAALWSEGLPDGDLKGSAMDRVANAYVDRDPEAAAAWASQYAGEAYAGRVIEEVGDEWAKKNPVAAVEWLDTLPAGSGQNSGLNSAYRRWAYADAPAAGERLVSMPPSPQRDAAISGFATGLAYRDPVAAIQWADSIAQDSVRQSTLTRAGQALFQRDRNAAREWVVTSGLPPEAQQAVLNPPRRR